MSHDMCCHSAYVFHKDKTGINPLQVMNWFSLLLYMVTNMGCGTVVTWFKE